MKIGIILQARMGSSRLPGKILKKIGPKTLLEHIFFRLRYLKHSVHLVLATSTSPKDDAVVSFCQDHSVKCYRGSENNVLERYYLCAQEHQFDHIVRLTGDNPFVDIEELDRLIDLHLEMHADYSHSFRIMPLGIGAEIFTFGALAKSFKAGLKPNHLEHVNEYIEEHPERFVVAHLDVPMAKRGAHLRLTVDTEEDYRCACFIVQNAQEEFITTEEAIRLCMRFA